MEMARVQEKEMKEDGTYYNTKYKLKDKVLMKLPGWDELKKGRKKVIEIKNQDWLNMISN